MVVKIADSLASSLKQAICESFVATVSNIHVSVRYKGGIQVEVKRLSCSLFWIKPISQENFCKLSNMYSLVNDSHVRRVDRWTEVLGPVLHPVWVSLKGIPLHAWDEKVFHRLGECLGIVMEIDEEATCRERIDRVRVLILRDPQRSIPQKIALEIEGVLFYVFVGVDDDCRCSGKISWPAESRLEFGLPENHASLIAELVPKFLSDTPVNLRIQIQNKISNDIKATIKEATPVAIGALKMPFEAHPKNPTKQMPIVVESGFRRMPRRKRDFFALLLKGRNSKCTHIIC